MGILFEFKLSIFQLIIFKEIFIFYIFFADTLKSQEEITVDREIMLIFRTKKTHEK